MGVLPAPNQAIYLTAMQHCSFATSLRSLLLPRRLPALLRARGFSGWDGGPAGGRIRITPNPVELFGVDQRSNRSQWMVLRNEVLQRDVVVQRRL
jgi:hypothetical protein